MKRCTWIPAVGIAALSFALALGSCAKAPQAEVDAARSAVAAAAQNGDVPVYAPDTLKRAQDSLSTMEAELKAKLDFKALASMLASAKSTVAEAKADFDSGSYGPARDKAIGAKTSLADLTRQISEGVQAATKKK
jgi:hypothetical protein